MVLHEVAIDAPALPHHPGGVQILGLVVLERPLDLHGYRGEAQTGQEDQDRGEQDGLSPRSGRRRFDAHVRGHVLVLLLREVARSIARVFEASLEIR